jgi:SAM-dependent methyltransferase
MTEPQTDHAEADHNARIVAQFTRWAQPFADLPLHSEAEGMARLVAAAAVTPAARVLDVACGPGIVACELARHAGHVTGIDLTPAMIAQAERRQREHGLSNLAWQIGEAGSLPFADAEFDTVVTRYSFHHLRDPGRALAEMARVCRPGGRVLVVDVSPSAETRAAYDAMETIRDRSHASALTQAELRALGHELGLTEVSVAYYRTEALLPEIADAADMPALDTLFDADIASGQDRIGVAARRTPEGIRFSFPISVVAWDR